MILTVEDDFDKEHGTDLPMYSRVGKTTVSMYIAFSQAAMSKKEQQEFLKNHPGMEPEEYKELMKKRVQSKFDTGVTDFTL